MAKKTRNGSIWTFADRFEGDKVVWIIVLMLILLSIVCLFSSSSRLLKNDLTRIDIMREQLRTVVMGLGLIVVCYNIKNMNFFRFFSLLGFPVSFLLLLLLDMHINTPVIKAINLNNAYRILKIGGIQLHVFEIVKVAMVMYLSRMMDALKNNEFKFIENPMLKKIVLLYAPFLITMVMIIPGSNSSALFIGGIMFLLLLLGGGNLKDMSVLFLAGVILISSCYGLYKVSDGKIMGRIGTGISRVFEDEDNEKIFLESRKGSKEYQNALDAIRQPYSAKIAIHEGGPIGKGPGQSTQRYVVPDMSEDYMFSFVIEEYGLLGALLVIFLYVSLLARASIIVRNCKQDHFARLAVSGLSLLITGQAFLHMLVNVDLGPMTGQTLPLISHGNSAFLCFSIAFGIILSFSRMATRKIEQQTKEAAPLMEMHENIRAGLDELDAFDSMDGQNGLNDENYGI